MGRYAGLILGVLIALTSFSVAAAIGRCKGYAPYPDLAAVCRSLDTKTKCLAGFAQEGYNNSASCTWRDTSKANTSETVILYSRYPQLGASLSNGRGDVGNQIRITLPKNTTGWGANSVYSTSVTANECTAGVGEPRACVTRTVAPPAYAQNAAFKAGTQIVSLIFSDGAYVRQLQKNGGVLDAQVPIRLDYAFLKDATPPVRPTPMVTANTRFGSMGVGKDKSGVWKLTTYATYRIANVSGVDWTVGVAKNLDGSDSKKATPLTVFLAREAELDEWLDTCAKRCAPPVALAVKVPACVGRVCKGQARGLGASAAYTLFVSYPQIYSLSWDKTYSAEKPVRNPWTNQVVDVLVNQNRYVLNGKPVGGARSAAAGGDGDDEPALGPFAPV